MVETVAAANQFGTLKMSLEGGVRPLMLDVHFLEDTKTEISLCHASCKAGAVKIETTFDTIYGFLDIYPDNVITIIWEMTCDGEADCIVLKRMLYDGSEQSRLANILYEPLQTGDPWPTLREMIQNNQKIVQFFERGPFERPWDL